MDIENVYYTQYAPESQINVHEAVYCCYPRDNLRRQDPIKDRLVYPVAARLLSSMLFRQWKLLKHHLEPERR